MTEEQIATLREAAGISDDIIDIINSVSVGVGLTAISQVLRAIHYALLEEHGLSPVPELLVSIHEDISTVPDEAKVH